MLGPLLRLLGIYKIYEHWLERQIRDKELPKHIGIILDGNRRWAWRQGYPSWLGHEFGAKRAEEFLHWCLDLDLKTITLYILSTENLQRSRPELEALLRIINERLRSLRRDPRIYSERVRVKSLGKLDLLPQETRRLLAELEESTKEHDGHFLNIAIAYGGRMEIVEGVRRIAERVRRGELEPSSIDQEVLSKHLYTSHLPNPEPDLIIRTSGEERLSGFLIWQSAYSELVFMDVYWPDFRRIDLMRAIRTWQKRHRRFGK